MMELRRSNSQALDDILNCLLWMKCVTHNKYLVLFQIQQTLNQLLSSSPAPGQAHEVCRSLQPWDFFFLNKGKKAYVKFIQRSETPEYFSPTSPNG